MFPDEHQEITPFSTIYQLFPIYLPLILTLDPPSHSRSLLFRNHLVSGGVYIGPAFSSNLDLCVGRQDDFAANDSAILEMNVVRVGGHLGIARVGPGVRNFLAPIAHRAGDRPGSLAFVTVNLGGAFAGRALPFDLGNSVCIVTHDFARMVVRPRFPALSLFAVVELLPKLGWIVSWHIHLLPFANTQLETGRWTIPFSCFAPRRFTLFCSTPAACKARFLFLFRRLC